MFSEMAIEAEIWEATKESDAILVADDHGIITWITGTCERLFGYLTRKELVGKSVHTLVPGAIREKHADYFRGFWDAPSARPMGNTRILEGQHKDGHTFKVSVTLAPWTIAGRRQVKASIAEMGGV